jgi:very-short-patch-repair endonuclease
MSADKRTPEENRVITKAASRANKGSEHTVRHRSRLAISREKNPKIDPVYEQPLIDICNKLGIKNVPQKAFYKFNVDLYLTDDDVVIEIFGGGFHNKKDAVEMFKNKMSYLSKKKIPVVVVWSDKITYDPKKVLAVARNVESLLTVINGDGTPTTRGLKDITG